MRPNYVIRHMTPPTIVLAAHSGYVTQHVVLPMCSVLQPATRVDYYRICVRSHLRRDLVTGRVV